MAEKIIPTKVAHSKSSKRGPETEIKAKTRTRAKYTTTKPEVSTIISELETRAAQLAARVQPLYYSTQVVDFDRVAEDTSDDFLAILALLNQQARDMAEMRQRIADLERNQRHKK